MYPRVEAHMYVWMHMGVCVYVEARDGSLGTSLIVLYLFTVTDSLAESSTLSLSWSNKPACLRDPVSTFLELELEVFPCPPGFHMGTRKLNADPHTYPTISHQLCHPPRP